MSKTDATDTTQLAASRGRRSIVTALASARDRMVAARPVSTKRRAVALAIALAADVLQLVLWPAFAEGAASPFDDALDLVVGAALWATLGMSPRLALAFAMELVPGADLFPTWTAVVLSIPVATASPAEVPETPPTITLTSPAPVAADRIAAG